MLSYLTIVAVALLAAFGAPWYFLFIGAAVLTALAIRDQRQYQSCFATLGISGLLVTAAHASASHALLAALAAYALGIFARIVFLTG